MSRGLLRMDLSGGPLEAEYRRCVEGLLRSRESLEAPPEPRHDPADPAVRLAADNWRGKMRQEHDAAVLFSGLLPQLMAAGAPLDLKMACLRASMDELHHARLCADVVAWLGQEPELETRLDVPPLVDQPGCTATEVALRNLLFIGCLSETVAVAFLTECREHIEDPWIARINRQLLSDETLHARLGWHALGILLPRMGADERERTNHFLRVALGHFEQEFQARASEAVVPEPLLSRARALGFSYGRVARELLVETLEEVILPSLDSVGLDGRKAWAEREQTGRAR